RPLRIAAFGGAVASYDIGVVDVRLFSVFSAADAKRIVAATGKKPRHNSRRTAETLNWALTRMIVETSVALAEPASKKRARAKRLQAALGQVLQLMGLDTQLPPGVGEDPGDAQKNSTSALVSAYSVLLPAGESASLSATCAVLGFSSTQEAIWKGINGLW